MPRTDLDTGLFGQLATGVALLDASLRATHANPAFLEHIHMGRSRVVGRTLECLTPDGARLHGLALAAQREGNACTLASAVVCAAPDHEARLDFTLTPTAEGVLVEAHPASAAADSTRTSESLRGFAHEVRNPLAAISGAAQLLQQGAHDTRQQQLAQLIRDEAQRLATLAERLLGTRQVMATRAVNVHALLERVVDLLAAERVQVAITRDYDPSLPAWHGDPDRLLQAVLNLVRNAVEAHARRIVLRSRAEAGWRDARGQPVPALRIEVDDDGDGVPDAIAATLFEPMVSSRAGGTGLGLALAREIAREHGGELTCRRRGPGACFVLLLPRWPRTGAHA